MESTIHDVMWLTVVVGLGRRWSLACELPTHKRPAHLVTTPDILSGHNGDAMGLPLAARRGGTIWWAGHGMKCHLVDDRCSNLDMRH